jgi:hypothetical protein
MDLKPPILKSILVAFPRTGFNEHSSMQVLKILSIENASVTRI